MLPLATPNDRHLVAMRLAARIEQAKEKMSFFNETIVSVALRLGGGTVLVLPQPERHHNFPAYMKRSGISTDAYHVAEQGFFTSRGRFVDRKTAKEIAIRANQLLKPTTNPRLFSEDLW